MARIILTLAASLAVAGRASAFGPSGRTDSEGRNNAASTSGVFSLSPLASCGADAVCYESTSESALAKAMLNPFMCKDVLMRAGNCSLYAFPNRVGLAPFNAKVTKYSAPGNHLWFSIINQLVPGGSKTGGRCGEVDAALKMPAAIFKKKNAKSLALYIKATNNAFGTLSGRCADQTRRVYKDKYDNKGHLVNRNFTAYSGVGSTRWTTRNNGNSLGKLCQSACGCVLDGTWSPTSKVCRETPENCACQDVPDDPSGPVPGNFCSLCGPTFNSNAELTLYTIPVPPPPPVVECAPSKGCTVCEECCQTFVPDGKSCNACVAEKCSTGTGKTIVDLAAATPDLATLVAALKAGGLIPTLYGAGPFTVFAPTNEGFAGLPKGTVASLLKPQNKAQLVDILTYHVVPGNLQAKDLTDGQKLKTVQGQYLTVRLAGGVVFIDSSKVTTANVEASNGVVHIIDAVLTP